MSGEVGEDQMLSELRTSGAADHVVGAQRSFHRLTTRWQQSGRSSGAPPAGVERRRSWWCRELTLIPAAHQSRDRPILLKTCSGLGQHT